MTATNSKLAAKNALALTLRMILATIVGLYTSRIVLQALGVDDYGIYGVIGGVVGMASFLNASMAGATSRFITFELGRGNSDKLRKIFSNALIIHIFIAIIVAILAETVGLWFVNNKMNFPSDRMFAVNILYQFTIASMFVGFTQVPYTAVIIAHEKMSIYAYFEIVNVILKLIIVYIILIVNTDCLILYAALTFGITIVNALIYRYYCVRHYEEAHLSLHIEKNMIREMLTFSGFDLYGNMCVVAKSQGTPIILNMFFGVVANAAVSIATTITGAIGGLTTTVAQAFKPQIIKYYAKKDIVSMRKMLIRSVQFTLLAYSALAIPFCIKTDAILYLWLGQVPMYSAEFVRLIVLSAMFEIMINSNNTGIHATGNIKHISFVNGTFYLLCPVISFFILKSGYLNVYLVYITNAVMMLIVTFMGWYFIKKQIPGFNINEIIIKITRVWSVILLSAFLVWIIEENLGFVFSSHLVVDHILSLITISIVNVIILFLLSLLISFDKSERHMIIQYIIARKRVLL